MLIDGKPGDRISAFDRAFQYGDGLFETLAVRAAEPCLWNYHMERLEEGARRLDIAMPDCRTLASEARREIDGAASGVLKIQLSRGSSRRGYAPPVPAQPCRVMAFHSAPALEAWNIEPGIHARICRTPLGVSPLLAGLKHLNRLEQVLARAEWNDPEIAEGLMLDVDGQVIEGTASNLFLVQGDCLVTPDLTRCGVVGVLRRLVLEMAEALGIPVQIRAVRRAELFAADGLFFTNSLIGMRSVARLDGVELRCRSPHPELLPRVEAAAFMAGNAA